jgi:hypothetical protein
MFESFVIGPVAGNRLGVVRQCVDCVTAAGPGARPCGGFGPGCLSTPSRADPIDRGIDEGQTPFRAV